MKKLRFLLTVTVAVILFAALTYNNAQSEPKASNPLIGSWKVLGVFDSTGTAIEYYADEVGYETILEDGTFFYFGFRKNFPKTGKNPKTLEDYKEIDKNCWGRIAKYKVDIKNHKISAKYTHDLRPKSIGHELTANFKVVGDTAIYWFDGSKKLYKYLRVK